MELTLNIDNHKIALLGRDVVALIYSMDDNPFYSETYDKLAKSQSCFIREAVARKRNISEETWKALISDPVYSVVENAILNCRFRDKISLSVFFNIYNQHQRLIYTLISYNLVEVLTNDENTEDDIKRFYDFILHNKDEEIKTKYIEAGFHDKVFLKKFLRDENPALVAFTKRVLEG